MKIILIGNDYDLVDQILLEKKNELIGVIDKKPLSRSQGIGVELEEQSDEESGDIALTTLPNRDDPIDSGEQSDEEPSGIVLTTVPNRDDPTDTEEQSDEEPSGIVLTTVPNRDDPNDPNDPL